MGVDHPIAWCQDYDGGRSWYTGLGHTDASFAEPAVPRPPARRHPDRRRRRRPPTAPRRCRDELREGHPRRQHRRTRWSSRSPPTAASSTSTATARQGDPAQRQRRDRRSTSRLHRSGVRAARRRARPRLRRQRLGLPLLLAATGGRGPIDRVSRIDAGPATPLGHDRARGRRPRHRRPARPVLPRRRRARVRHRRQPLHRHRRQHQPVRVRRLHPDRRARRPRPPGTRSARSANTNDLRGKMLRITPQADGGYTVPEGNLFAAGTADDPARDLRDGLPQPVPDRRRHEQTGNAPRGRLRPGRRRGQRQPRARRPRRVEHRQRARHLRLAVLRRRQHAPTTTTTSRPAPPVRRSTAPAARSTTRRTTPGSPSCPPPIPADDLAGQVHRPASRRSAAAARRWPAPTPTTPTSTPTASGPPTTTARRSSADWNNSRLFTVPARTRHGTDVHRHQPVPAETCRLDPAARDCSSGPTARSTSSSGAAASAATTPTPGVYRIDYVQGNRAPIAQASADKTVGPGPADGAVRQRRVARPGRRRR